MLDRLIQGRAISVNGEGASARDTFRAKIAHCSRFVLRGRAVMRVAIAGWVAIYLVAIGTIEVRGDIVAEFTMDRRLVSPMSLVCAHRVAQGADNGSEAASMGASGSGSQCQTAPKALNLKPWEGRL